MTFQNPVPSGGKPARYRAQSARTSLLFAAACSAFATTGVILASCSSDAVGPNVNTPDGSPGATTSSGASGQFGSTTSSSGSTSGGGTSSSGNPVPVDEAGACVADVKVAQQGRRPVDIIFAIDNSFSMEGAIGAVENQINDNFTAVLAQGLADYRVILVSKHGSHDPVNQTVQGICIHSPLSGTNCTPVPLQPAETDRFFHHDVVVNSTDSWCKLFQTYATPDDLGNHPQGWGGLLRTGAFKVFAIITDDHIQTSCTLGTNATPTVFDDRVDDTASAESSAGAFDSALVALSPDQFGTANSRNYVWHSIVGLATYNPADTNQPYPPDAPLNKVTCTRSTTGDASADAVTPGLAYQALSRLTGGLRYPMCGLNYNPIFRAMAQDVIGKTFLACDYAMPANPDGGTIDPLRTVAEYTAPGADGGTGTTSRFSLVASAAACDSTADKFYIDSGRLHLCPSTCNFVQKDSAASLKILFGCQLSQLPPTGGPK